jgi:hypothetical protein
MSLSSKELEALADNLLRKELKDCSRNKSTKTEYPILSESQISRRQSMEIPYSNLTPRQRLTARYKNYDLGGEEEE